MPLKRKTNKTGAADIFEYTFANGVTLIAEPIEAVRTAAIGFWFSCGSRREKKAYSGVTHFAEHMLFKGTKTRSAFDIASAFDRMGGYANAFTEREQVCLYCVVPADRAEDALDILCDMAENSVFPAAEIERERTVIESEIAAASDDPEEAAFDAVARILWPNDPLSLPIAGTVSGIKKIDADFLRSWYTDFFQNGELTVCVSGNIRLHSFCARLEKAGRHLKNPRAENDFRKDSLPPRHLKSKPSRVHFLNADFQQEQFFVLYPLMVPCSLRHFYCRAVLNALIGDTMSSRLFQALRERSGYCYTVYSFFSVYTDCGYWCAYVCAPKKNAAKIVAAIRAELALLVQSGFTFDEVSAAKEHVCGEEIINAEDTEHRMKRLARSRFSGFEQTDFDRSIEAIRNLSDAELTEELRRLLNPDCETMIIYGPELSESVRKRIEKTL